MLFNSTMATGRSLCLVLLFGTATASGCVTLPTPTIPTATPTPVSPSATPTPASPTATNEPVEDLVNSNEANVPIGDVGIEATPVHTNTATESGGGSPIAADSFDLALTYNGRPLTEFTSINPVFQVKQLVAGQQCPDLAAVSWKPTEARYDEDRGIYTLSGVPADAYCLVVWVDTTTPFGGRATDPGDYKVSSGYGLAVLDVHGKASGAQRLIGVPLSRVIHLTSPADNVEPIGSGGKVRPYYRSPFKAEWDPLPEAVEYRVNLGICTTTQCTDRVSVDSFVTAVSVFEEDLPVLANDKLYFLNVTARNERGDPVGDLAVNSSGGGWSGGLFFYISTEALSGRVMHNNEPISRVTDRQPTVMVKPLPNGRTCPDQANIWVRLDAVFDVETSKYTVEDLEPGNYCVWAEIDAAEPFDGRAYQPGDYSADVSGHGDSVTVSSISPATVDFTMLQYMHLTAPYDNAVELPSGELVIDGGIVASELIHVAWGPVPGATSYLVGIGGCLDSLCNGSAIRNSLTTRQTEADIALPAAEGVTLYNLFVAAHDDEGKEIGRVSGFHPGGWADGVFIAQRPS